MHMILDIRAQVKCASYRIERNKPRSTDIYIMNADGSGLINSTQSSDYGGKPRLVS